MAKIYEDEHGLYLKCDGSICRPVIPNFWKPKYQDGTKHQEGDNVPARHIGESLIRVGRKGPDQEMWFIHGNYLPGNTPSEECWKPVPAYWD